MFPVLKLIHADNLFFFVHFHIAARLSPFKCVLISDDYLPWYFYMICLPWIVFCFHVEAPLSTHDHP